MITQKGRELYKDLYGADAHVPAMEDCSLICRHATSYGRNQEDICNGHPAMAEPWIDGKTANRLQVQWEARTDKRDVQLERLIGAIAKRLPGVKGVEFGGDPRGFTVKLITENGKSNNWGEGIGVPGS